MEIVDGGDARVDTEMMEERRVHLAKRHRSGGGFAGDTIGCADHLPMLHVAAASPAYSLANDTTYYGLEDDVLTKRLTIRDGAIAVPTSPGLGIEVDPEKLRQYAVRAM